jgi:ATP-dependent Clp protease ATP-binding subunit ClpC
VDLQNARSEVEKLAKSGPDLETTIKLRQTPRFKKVIEYAIEESGRLGHDYVGTEHLLLGLIRERDGVAATVLMNLGVQLDAARESVLDILGGEPPSASRFDRHETVVMKTKEYLLANYWR